MKKVFPLLVLILFVFSCKPTKDVSSAVGSWDFEITGLPDGTTTGVLVIAQEGDSFSGTISAQGSGIDLNNVSIENDELKSDFYFQGYKVDMTGTFSGTDYKGKITVDYNDFPMTATKQE